MLRQIVRYIKLTGDRTDRFDRTFIIYVCIYEGDKKKIVETIRSYRRVLYPTGSVDKERFPRGHLEDYFKIVDNFFFFFFFTYVRLLQCKLYIISRIER